MIKLKHFEALIWFQACEMTSANHPGTRQPLISAAFICRLSGGLKVKLKTEMTRPDRKHLDSNLASLINSKKTTKKNTELILVLYALHTKNLNMKLKTQLPYIHFWNIFKIENKMNWHCIKRSFFFGTVTFFCFEDELVIFNTTLIMLFLKKWSEGSCSLLSDLRGYKKNK